VLNEKSFFLLFLFPLIWRTEPAENKGSIREKGLLTFKQELLPYLLQTRINQSISYQISPVVDHANTPDPWNQWTFNPGLQVNGQSSSFEDSNP